MPIARALRRLLVPGPPPSRLQGHHLHLHRLPLGHGHRLASSAAPRGWRQAAGCVELDGHRFHYVWLRDHCPCARCVDPHSRQKTHASSAVPLAVRPRAARWLAMPEPTLEIVWDRPLAPLANPCFHEPALARQGSDAADRAGHVSRYPLSWLLNHSYSSAARSRRAIARAPTHWDAASIPGLLKSFPFQSVMSSDRSLHGLLSSLHAVGIAFVDEMHVEPTTTVEALVERIGPVLETFYGKSWDVRSVPEAKNVAYTAVELGLHMDLMYFESPPGIQFLHCLENAAVGGDSLFLDSYAALALMRRDHPEHLAVLARNDATFHYRAGSHRLVQRRPMLSSPGCNSVSPTASVFYAPPFQGVLDSVPEDEMEAYYAALQAWDALVAAPALTHRSRLFPGRCVVFDNRRVLHARTAFDPASGPRHLKGSYLRMDDFLDRLRGLEVSLQIGERNALSDDSLHPVV